MGLATTYGAVKQAGGSIEVYSEVGMGTTFRIYLPRVEGEPTEVVSADRPQKLKGGTETVLLVEDEDIVRKLCIGILEGLGYKVLPAGNGDEAITLALGYGERIDLLLTDVVMPGMNGRELANRLARIHPETRVLFTSGYTDNAIVHHGVLDEGVSFHQQAVLSVGVGEEGSGSARQGVIAGPTPECREGGHGRTDV